MPVREMNLVEVDTVGLQPLERLVDGIEDVGANELRGPATAEPLIGGASDHLGGEDDVVAVAARLHPVADDLLGAALRLRLRRDGIEFGRVEEVDAARKGQVHLLVAFLLGVLLAPRHGSEADFRDRKVRPAKAAVFHGATPGVLLKRRAQVRISF